MEKCNCDMITTHCDKCINSNKVNISFINNYKKSCQFYSFITLSVSKTNIVISNTIYKKCIDMFILGIGLRILY